MRSEGGKCCPAIYGPEELSVKWRENYNVDSENKLIWLIFQSVYSPASGVSGEHFVPSLFTPKLRP